MTRRRTTCSSSSSSSSNSSSSSVSAYSQDIRRDENRDPPDIRGSSRYFRNFGFFTSRRVGPCDSTEYGEGAGGLGEGRVRVDMCSRVRLDM